MLGNLARPRHTEERSNLSVNDYLRLWENFGFNGVNYIVPAGGTDEMRAVQAERNPIVWACVCVRLMIFSEIRFTFQAWQAGRPGHMWGDKRLALLETPWPGATTGDLLARMETDASFYGNSYWTKSPDGSQVIRLDPRRVTIATGDFDDVETDKPYGKRLLGYFLHDDRGNVVSTFLPDEVAHYKPLPDPAHEFRGATWLNALLPDIIADGDLTDFKHSYLRTAATPNLVVRYEPGVSKEAATSFREKMESSHSGPQNGFKTLYLGAGADVKVVGSNFQELALNAVQSAGETRIAAAAGVPASVVGLAEGLKGSALNAGNYSASRRRLSDGTMRPMWRSAAGALSVLVKPDPGSRLWYDDRDVSFLQEDVTDAAAILEQNAKTILVLVQAGYTPDSIVSAVSTGDMNRLEHTGLMSVQLQSPAEDGITLPAPPANPALPA